jgi:hypothetical protein
MRRSAYLKALKQASQLPTEIPEFRRYFHNSYNPRLEAIAHIKKAARLDVDGLSDSEAVDVMTWKEPGKDSDGQTS